MTASRNMTQFLYRNKRGCTRDSTLKRFPNVRSECVGSISSFTYFCLLQYWKLLSHFFSVFSQSFLQLPTSGQQRNQPKMWGGKYFDFRRATCFVGHCLSKHKTTRYARKLGDADPFASSWIRLFRWVGVNRVATGGFDGRNLQAKHLASPN